MRSEIVLQNSGKTWSSSRLELEMNLMKQIISRSTPQHSASVYTMKVGICYIHVCAVKEF